MEYNNSTWKHQTWCETTKPHCWVFIKWCHFQVTQAYLTIITLSPPSGPLCKLNNNEIALLAISNQAEMMSKNVCFHGLAGMSSAHWTGTKCLISYTFISKHPIIVYCSLQFYVLKIFSRKHISLWSQYLLASENPCAHSLEWGAPSNTAFWSHWSDQVWKCRWTHFVNCEISNKVSCGYYDIHVFNS